MSGPLTETSFRVRYAETDQMGVAHHSHYIVWCELGRTHHMREQGVSYRELEAGGIRLPVVEVALRYRSPARYDDLLTVRTWVRACRSRLVEFGNAVLRSRDDHLLATARIRLIAIDESDAVIRIPSPLRERLVPCEDPVGV